MRTKADEAYMRAVAPTPLPTRFYWAYGSNLCIAQMQRRCPGAVQVGALMLDNSMLVFRGVADVIGRTGQRTPGGLWRITAGHEETLDRQEGVRSGVYRKVYITLGTEDGLTHQCLVYQMCAKGIMPPRQSYVDIIAQGYDDFQLDKSYLDRALQHAWNDKQLTPLLRRRRELNGGMLAKKTTQGKEIKIRARRRK